jgi:mono/diheme cytochrome c family protein
MSRTQSHRSGRGVAWPSCLLLLAALVVSGCRQDMHDQPKFEPLEASSLFVDGRSSRAPVEGTVARGQLREDAHLYQGLQPDGQPVATFPYPMTPEQLQQGRERYDVFCSPCHGRSGDGLGMIVRRGFKQPTSFHDPRLRDSPPGYFFTVITNGFGQMSSYASQVKPEERWAIVAYIRALQLAANAPVESLSEEERQRLAEPVGDQAPAEETEDS